MLLEELRALGHRGEVFPGGVDVPGLPRPVLAELRAAEEAVDAWGRRTVRTLDDVRAAAARLCPARPAAASFRVWGRRLGVHPFDRIALERAVGAVLHARWDLPVSLGAPELSIRAVVAGDQLVLGRRIAGFEPPPRPFNQRVSLAPVVAAALVRWVRTTRPARVRDPLCGAGTLLVAAGARYADAVLEGSDWAEAAARGAEANLAAAGLRARAEVATRDALAPGPDRALADLLIGNPPFGLTLARRMKPFAFHRRLLERARGGLVPGAEVVLLVHRPEQVAQAAVEAGYRVEDRHAFSMGSTRPTLVRLRAPPR